MASEWAAQVVGIRDYPNYTTLSPLTASAEDAEKIATQLEQYGYRTFRVQRLPGTPNQKGESKIDPQGTVKVQELREAIANLFNPPHPNPIPETALFFFSGHGWYQTINGKKEVFLATSDALPEKEIYGIPLSWLGDQLQKSQVKRVIVWLDCCYSGELLRFVPTDKDYCLITATRSYETGIEVPHEQGLLTQVLLEGLNPQIDPDGMVNSHKLADFIENRMVQTGQCPLTDNSKRAILLTTKSPKRSFQDKCPYRSLSYFSENQEDAEVFYGRDALTQQLIQKVVNKQRLITVLGASGSGKSSLLRAGLLYRLKLGQEIPGSDRWIYIAPFTPKETPLDSLIAACSGTFPELFLHQDTTVNILHQLVGKLKALNTPTVLIIDQFEECFTMSDESKQKELFFKYLRELIDGVDTISILIGMRSDFRARLREYPQVAEKLTKPLIVEHLTSQEIEAAITKPADLVGLGIEGELKQKLISDVEDYPGSLPLLQYTLTELWRESRKQTEEFLRLKTYEDLGGIEGTLQKRADEIYESLLAEEKTVAQRIFLELTQIGETTDTRRRVRLQQLVNSHHSLQLLQQVSEKLATKDARLITKTNDQESYDVILDVVHEALLRHWTQLNEWKREYQTALAIERRLEDAAREWQENERKSEYLLQETRLGLAEDYLEKYGGLGMLDGVAEQYIEESQKLRDRLHQQEEKRRQRELETAQQLAQAQEKARQQAEQRLEIAQQLAQFQEKARQQAEQRAQAEEKARKQAEEARKQAVINQISALRASSEAQFVSNQKLDALISSLHAGKKLNELLLQTFPPTTKLKDEVKVTLQKVVYQVRERNRLNGHQNVDGIKVSFIPDNQHPDNQHLVTAGGDGTIKLWNFQGQQLLTWQNKLNIHTISISPNGQILATAGEDGIISLWNLKGQQLTTWKGNQSWIRSISFSPNGQLLATGGEYGARLWNLQGQQLAKLDSGRDWVWSVDFSPNGQLLATGGSDGTRLWNFQNGQVTKLEGDQEWVRSVSFSPNGQYLATTGDYGRVYLWNLQNRQLIECRQGDSSGLWSVSFSPDSQLLATGGNSNITRLWNLEGKQVAELKGNQTAVTSISFSLDGKRLATSGDGNTVDLWDLQGQQMATMVDRQDPIRDISFSPDGRQLATGGKYGTVDVWDLQGNELHKFSAHQGLIESISFSPDGQQLTTAGDDGTVRSWNLQGQKLAEEEFPVDVNNDFESLWFSPDKRLLAGITAQGSVHVINLQGEEFSFPIDATNANNYFIDLWFSPDSRLLAGIQGNGFISVWDLQDKSLKTNFHAHSGGINSILFYSNNQRLAIAGGDGTVRLRDLQGKQLLKFTAHQPGVGVQSLSLSPNGQQLATVGGEDRAVRLWNLQGQQLAEFPANAWRVTFSPDSQRIATLARDGSAQVWQIETFEELMKRGCDWVRDYLENNQTVENSDKHLCKSIGQE